MQYRTVLRPRGQLTLFQRPPTEPLWRDLPVEARAQAVQLLAKLLREHRERLCAGHAEPEVRDE